MFSKRLKPHLPRSLFGRAFLILIVPIVLIQVIVGVVFVERLFRDVTEQMTESVALDVNYLISLIENDKNPQNSAKYLEIGLRYLPEPDFSAKDRLKNYYDISGTYVIKTLYQSVPQAKSIDLGRDRSFAFIQAYAGDRWVEFKVARRRLSAKNPHQVLVAMLVASLVFSALSTAFLNNQIRPLRRLSRAAEAFGKGQITPLIPRGALEVRSATRAFLSMRERIERHIEQRTLMLSGVSHDLRTPLTRLRLSISMLEEDEETALMLRDLDEMTEIVDEFLAFARGDSAENWELVSPKDLAEQLVGNINRGGRVIDLAFIGAENADEPVKIRRTSVQRATSNILSNALKYGDKVKMTIYSGAGYVEFIIEDNGPGISAAHRKDALKPFGRLDSARNQDKGAGVGLGLAIAADVARSHGGSLTLGESADLGGLKAAFRLPR